MCIPECLSTLAETASAMDRKIPAYSYSTCNRKTGEPCYRSGDGLIHKYCNRKSGERCYRTTDGRFQIRNTWSADSVRAPCWLLFDHVTGHSYRFFVRMQAEQKVEALFALAGSADAGIL